MYGTPECRDCGTPMPDVTLEYDEGHALPVYCSDACRAESEAVDAHYRALRAERDKACPGCDRPGDPCPERADGGCRHCDAPVGSDIRGHHHPYRSTND